MELDDLQYRGISYGAQWPIGCFVELNISLFFFTEV